MRKAFLLVAFVVAAAIELFCFAQHHASGSRPPSSQSNKGPSQRIVLGGGGDLQTREMGQQPAARQPSDEVRSAPPGSRAQPEPGAVDPALLDLLSQLDQVCREDGNPVPTLAMLEGRADLLRRCPPDIVRHLNDDQARALMLLVLGRVDPKSVSRIRADLPRDASFPVRLASYWALVIDGAELGQTATTREQLWSEICGAFIFLCRADVEHQELFVRHVRPTSDPIATRELIHGMESSPEPTLRNLCALFLAPSRANDGVWDAFRDVLAHDTCAEVRHSAASFLSGDPSPEARAFLRAALEKDADEKVRGAATWTLASGADEDTIAYLVDRFHVLPSIWEQRAVISGLSHSSSGASTAFLASVVNSQRVTVLRADAVQALAKRGNDEAAVSAIVGALSSDDLYVRTVAAQCIGDTGAPSAIAPLQRAAQSDPDQWVRKLAQESLDKITKHP